MSLLDFNMPEMDSPQGQGILAAAFSLMNAKGPSLSNAIGQAGGQYMNTYQTAKENAAQAELRRLQIDAYKQKIEQEKAQAQQQARQRAAVQNLFSVTGGSGGFSPTTGKDGMPVYDGTMQFSPLVPPKLQLNQAAVLAALREGVTPEEIQKAAALENIGKSKVARTVKGIGPDGREYEYQVDDFGNKVGDGLAQFREAKYQDLGGTVAALDPYTNKPILSLPKSMTPDGKAANAVAWANNAISRERLSFDKAGGADANKPVYNAEAGGFIYRPDAQNPNGRVVPLAGAPDKPLTETQGNAALFASRALQAHQILTPLEEKGGGKPGAIKRTMTAITPGLGMNLDESMGTMLNWTQSKDQQAAEQAQRNFITAVLRKESGASISPGEYATAAQIYFPQPGDSDEVIKQKQATRESAINGMKVQSGTSGSKYVDQVSQQIPQDAINHLKMNPSLRSDFDAKYGKGASDKYLR